MAKKIFVALASYYIKPFNRIPLQECVDIENDIIIVSPWYSSSRNGEEDICSASYYIKTFNRITLRECVVNEEDIIIIISPCTRYCILRDPSHCFIKIGVQHIKTAKNQ